MEIVVACRESPAQFVGAVSPIATVDVHPAFSLQLWHPQSRTSRFHRELAGLVVLHCEPRWADLGLEYATLVAGACDGIVAIDGEVLEEIDPDVLDARELALAWRALDVRTRNVVEAHERAMLALDALVTPPPPPPDRSTNAG
jgi:hypothetical protein